jgi:hypothetical protein
MEPNGVKFILACDEVRAGEGDQAFLNGATGSVGKTIGLQN